MTDPLVVEQHVAAAPEALWSAWTSAEGLARWWWPHLPDATYEVDGKPGGGYRIESTAAGIGVQGEFLEVEEPHGLVITWQWLEAGVPGPVDRVAVELIRDGDGTLVRVTHLMSEDQTHDGYRAGWTDVLNRLASRPAQ